MSKNDFNQNSQQNEKQQDKNNQNNSKNSSNNSSNNSSKNSSNSSKDNYLALPDLRRGRTVRPICSYITFACGKG